MGGRVIRGIRHGRRGGDPWLFLHGWLDNAAAFIPLLPCLQKHIGPDADLVAVDMAGHGRSDHLGEAYLLVDYAADVLLIADALGWAEMSLVGHSLGGYAASLAAGTQPDRIKRLVLLDIIGPNGRPSEDAPAVLAKSVSWVAERSTGAKAGGSRLRVFPTVEEAAKQRSEKNIGGPMTLSNALLIASRGVVPANGALEAGFVWASDPRLLRPSLQELTPSVAVAFLRKIKCPTLVLTSRDGIYREMLRKGSSLAGQRHGSGPPLAHAFGRPFCAWLLLLSVLLQAAARLSALLGFPARQAALKAFARLTCEGWRTGRALRALRLLHYDELPAGGHHLHMTLPEETAGAIARWLRR